MNRERSSSRRSFMKYAAAFFGGSAFLLARGLPRSAKARQPLPESAPSGGGYRVTEHVKRYYETARR